VRAEFQRIETDAGNPLADKARILPGRQPASGATVPGEQELAGLPLGQAQIFVESLARFARSVQT
jgi:hypothetical protein